MLELLDKRPARQDLTRDNLRRAAATDFVRLLGCYAASGRVMDATVDLFTERHPRSYFTADITKAASVWTKAAILPGTTTNPAWAGTLVGIKPLVEAFVSLVRTKSVIGRLTDAITVPFMTQVPIQTAGGTYTWSGQAGTKIATKLGFDPTGVLLGPMKVTGTIPVTRELATLAVPGTEGALERELTNGITFAVDQQFVDPTVAPTANVCPGSVTYGLTPIASSGDVDKDIDSALAQVFAARPAATPVIICSPQKATAIAGTGKNVNARVDGGEAHGCPLLPTSATTHLIVLDQTGLILADAGVAIDASEEATYESDSAPVGGASAIMTSAWQTNIVVFKVERLVTWAALPGAVAIVT